MIPSGIEPATFLFVAQRLNHCAVAVPHVFMQYEPKCQLPLLFENNDELLSPERLADPYITDARYVFPDKNYAVFTVVAS